ncbi:MAG: hypothetical protein ACK41T_04605 [Pseudobdellovibrio sp.]
MNLKRNILFIILITSATIFSGCGPKIPVIKKTEINVPKIDVSESLRKSMSEFLLNKDNKNGEPGDISISGIIVKKDGDQFLLDERITTEQTIGQKCTTQDKTETSNNEKKSLRITFSTKSLGPVSESIKNSNTYFNVGCDQIPQSDIEGLVFDENSDNIKIDKIVFSVNAKKVFICDTTGLQQGLISINAESLYLKDVTLNIKKSIGLVFINTEKLHLYGDNLIATSNSTDELLSHLQAPNIHLSVDQEIHGEGKLKLKSTGADCLEKEVDKK